MFSPSFHRTVYLLGIVILLVGMPLSPAMMSISQFVLLINWIVEGNYTLKIKTLKTNTSAILVIGLFAIHLLWLLNTSDYVYGLKDIQTKLPLLIIPFVLGSAIRITIKELHLLLLLFIAAIVTASIACVFKLLGWIGEPIDDIRKMSFIISHIRFGLMICMAIFSAGYLLFQAKYSSTSKVILGITAIWLTLFLAIMSAITALLILGILTVIITMVFTYTKTSKIIFTIATISIGLFAVGFITWNYKMYKKQFTIVEAVPIEALAKTSPYGNTYYHSPTSISIENGNYIYRYICEKEIADAWAKRSPYPWDGKNVKGKEIQGILYRFLASKGFRKDKNGIASLSNAEIKAIENGIINVDLMGRSSLYKRIHQTHWEIGNYLLGLPAGGSSLTQRFEFWKAAVIIIKENWIFGVGTGDVKQAYNTVYKNHNFRLEAKYYKRAHNQYLTFLVTFGVFGFIFFLLASFYPLLLKQHPLFFVFMAIVLLSYLNEDTLESQAGATFFAAFFALLTAIKLPNQGNISRLR